MPLEENEFFAKQKGNENKKEETTPHTLINIQGNSLDIEMDDLAKGKQK